MNYLRTVWTIAQKDLKAERNSRELLSTMLIFALISVFIFLFAFELAAGARMQAFAGTIWTALCFAGTLGLNRQMGQERENGSMDALLLAPADRSAIFFGKALANWIIMLFLSALLLPLAGFFFAVNPFLLPLAGVILIGTLGYSLCGTLLAAITMKLRNRELFLPILLFPVLIPLLISAVRATNSLLSQAAPAEAITWLGILLAFDVIFVAAGLLLFSEVVSE